MEHKSSGGKIQPGSWQMAWAREQHLPRPLLLACQSKLTETDGTFRSCQADGLMAG